MAYNSHWSPRPDSLGLAKDLMLGMYFGFNLCCISNYVRLHAAGKYPGEYMWSMHGFNKEFRHVGCHECYKSNLKKPLRREAYKDIAQKYWVPDELIENESY